MRRVRLKRSDLKLAAKDAPKAADTSPRIADAVQARVRPIFAEIKDAITKIPHYEHCSWECEIQRDSNGYIKKFTLRPVGLKLN